MSKLYQLPFPVYYYYYYYIVALVRTSPPRDPHEHSAAYIIRVYCSAADRWWVGSY